MERPLLSICIPTYNRDKIVKECVESCLSVECDFIEVVVTDNCSTDDTRGMLLKIEDRRFRYCKNDVNIGYKNYAQCLKNGKGKFCFLLSDEDEIFEADWENVREFLADNNEDSVLQCEYFDPKGQQLLAGPQKIYKKNEYETYEYVKNYFAYSGGTFIRRDTLLKVWDKIDHDSILWNLYAQALIPMYSARYGNIQKMPYLKSRRTERDGKGFLDTKAWNGGAAEPYWSLKSRREQYLCWFQAVKGLGADELCCQKLLYQNRNDAVSSVYVYYCLLHNKDIKTNDLFLKRWDVIERDQALTLKAWIREIRRMIKEMDDELHKAMKEVKENRMTSLHFNIVRWKIFCISMLKIMIKEVTGL